MSDKVSVQIEDGIARIAMDDGKVNALCAGMLDEIASALDAAESAAAVTLLTGRAGIFSAGFDLSTFKRGLAATRRMLVAGATLIERLLGFPHPVLTACSGHAYPMGAFLMLSADVRLCADGPWRIGMNEVAIGLTVPKFAIELARHRLTPSGFAAITTAGMFEPEEARRLGFLDRVVPADELDAAVEEELSRLRTLDMPAYAETKARINERVQSAIRAAIEGELRPGAVAEAPTPRGSTG